MTSLAQTDASVGAKAPRVPTAPVIVAYLLLAAPIAAAALWWGNWVWVAVAAAIAVVEYATLQRSQRFSARVWRSVGVGKRSRREHGTETVYVATAVAGVALLVAAVLANYAV
ncbi:MAG: hypothetical protein QOI95_289 [Acidimicrobiaceae bacterium]|jgi:hypothetical protein